MKKILTALTYSVIWLLSLLPLPLLYLLTDILYFLTLVLGPFKYRCKVVRKNLTESFPDKSPAEIKRIERQFYHHFFDLIAESVKNFSASPRWMSRHMEFRGLEQVSKVFEEGRSAVMYLGHLGNWEWISSMPMHGDPVNVMCQVYHPLENKVMNSVFLKMRSRFGAESIPMATVLRQLLAYRDAGKNFIVGMIADQVPLWWNIHFWTDFLNHDTPVFSGTERIARKMDLAVFYGEVTRTRRGHYVCTARLMADHAAQTDEHQLTAEYFRLLEEGIRQQPAQWLWTHNRWKRDRAGYERWLQYHDN